MSQAPTANTASSPAAVNAPPHGKPVVVFIVNEQSPYRIHLLERIAREITGIAMHTLWLNEQPVGGWAYRDVRSINSILIGPGESFRDQHDFKRIPSEWRKGERIIRHLKEYRAVAAVLFGYNSVALLRTMRWCHSHDVPCFMWGDSNVRGDRSRGLKRAIKKIVVGQVGRWNAGLLPCGQMGVAYFEQYGIERSRMFLFPNEPDYEQIWKIEPAFVEDVAKRFGFTAGRRRIVFSGRLVDAKRVDLAIDAFVRIASRRPNWDLVIVGDGERRQLLQDRVPAELKTRAMFLGFFDDQKIVSAVYRASDLLVLPSDWEPWALVVNEAVAAGMAVVSSDAVGAAVEMVRNGVNGELFPQGDLEKLADALLRATDEANIERLKAGSADMLAEWRAKADPVNGIRDALASVNVLPPR